MEKDKLGLYVHIPFCIRKCAYCDFLSGPAGEEEKRAYVRALFLELEKEGLSHSGQGVETVFFGGGTPTCLPAPVLAEILEKIRANFFLLEEAEITLECNPGTVTAEDLLLLRRAGFNRLSLGLQSTVRKELEELGRIHTYEDFLATYKRARHAGFENINVDLMSALPGQTLESYENTLRQVLKLSPEHISAYSLIIEEGTPFFERYHDREDLLPSEEDDRRMYERTEELLLEKKFHRYEISNYALPGKECFHNIRYWERKPYLGFGLGASSMEKKSRWKNTSDMQEYLRTSNKEERKKELMILSMEDEMEEFFFLGLRLMKGVEEAAFERQFGVTVEEIYGKQLEKLQNRKLIVRANGRCRLTKRGIDVSNPVLAEFLLG